MKKTTTYKTQQRQMTRRELVGGALAAARVVTGAPAFLRGQNLNNKLNIAMIACGGRALANMNGDGGGGAGRGREPAPEGAQHVRSARPSKEGRGNPKSFRSPQEVELLPESALGRLSLPYDPCVSGGSGPKPDVRSAVIAQCLGMRYRSRRSHFVRSSASF